MIRYFIPLAFLCACGTTSIKISGSETIIGEAPYDASIHKAAEEELKYNLSIAKINRTFAIENIKLQMCHLINGDDGCRELQSSLCKINIFLDTRGKMHDKPYCE